MENSFKDILEIRVHSSYGDTFERELEDPTCTDVIHEFTQIAQQIGYPLGCIYEALLDEAESVKDQIRVACKHIEEIENKK